MGVDMEPGFKALDFFLLRTPRLPSSGIHKLNGLDSKEAAWDYVNELLSDPEILDAIYFASEDLFHEVTNHHGSEYTSSKSMSAISACRNLRKILLCQGIRTIFPFTAFTMMLTSGRRSRPLRNPRCRSPCSLWQATATNLKC